MNPQPTASTPAQDTWMGRCDTSGPAMTSPVAGRPKPAAHLSDGLGDLDAMPEQDPVGIGPPVDLTPGHDQCV